MMITKRRRPSGWDDRVLGMGSTGVVSMYSETTVLKGYVVWLDGRSAIQIENSGASKRSLDREHQVYERLGTHANILRYFGRVEVEPGIYSLELELASLGDLRSLIQVNNEDVIPRLGATEVGD